MREMWFDSETGKLDRPNGPAITEHFETDGRSRRGETYYMQGVVMRSEDLPSTVVVDVKTGVQVFQEWSAKDGSVSRSGGKPAILTKDLETGVIIKEQYWENGKPHRMDGPADIERDRSTGEVTNVRFFIRGKETAASGPHKNDAPQP